MSKLNYSSIAALIADFKAGAKFEIAGPRPVTPGPVLSMRPDPDGVRVFTATSDYGSVFAVDGSHAVGDHVYLSKVGDAPKVTLTPTGRLVFPKIEFPEPQHPTLRALLAQAIALKTDESIRAAAAKASEPFLKRFVLGEPAYCPKTRETVKAVEFVNGAINVTLVNGDGIERVSTSYDHEGKHHWIKERSLVIGALPPVVKPDAKVEVYLFESTRQPGTFRAVTLGGPVDYTLFRQVGYGTVVAQGRQRG